MRNFGTFRRTSEQLVRVSVQVTSTYTEMNQFLFLADLAAGRS